MGRREGDVQGGAGSRVLEHLCGEIGIRWAGTEGEHRAAHYLAEEFRRLGLQVSMPKIRYIGWEPLGAPEFAVQAPETLEFTACPYYFAAPTAGWVEGRLEYAGQAILTRKWAAIEAAQAPVL